MRTLLLKISPTSGIVMQLKRELQQGEMQYALLVAHRVNSNNMRKKQDVIKLFFIDEYTKIRI